MKKSKHVLVWRGPGPAPELEGFLCTEGIRAKALYRGKSLYGEVQGIVSNGHMGHPPVDKHTDTTENTTFPQLRWREVKKAVSKV